MMSSWGNIKLRTICERCLPWRLFFPLPLDVLLVLWFLIKYKLVVIQLLYLQRGRTGGGEAKAQGI